jgi:neutral ceramidase
LFVIRIADRAIISMPGEATVEVGRRARARVLAALRGSGVRGIAVSGLANEFIQYITTPEEYDRQHYEGGSTIYGPATAAAITDSLVELAERLRRGQAAPEPAPFDPRNGLEPTGEPFGRGADSATALSQPPATPPGAQAAFAWQGGPRGLDRPLDRRFLAIQRRDGKRWRRVADDLGLAIAWTVDDAGRHEMRWQVPRRARPGRYRVLVSANRYRLRSRPFAVKRSAPAPELDPNHPATLFAPITNR